MRMRAVKRNEDTGRDYLCCRWNLSVILLLAVGVKDLLSKKKL